MLDNDARVAVTIGSIEASDGMAKVFIGADPHKLSATIAVVGERERVVATGRFGTDKAGYAAVRRRWRAGPAGVFAVEGSSGAAGC